MEAWRQNFKGDANRSGRASIMLQLANVKMKMNKNHVKLRKITQPVAVRIIYRAAMPLSDGKL